jgi:DNA-binding NarL/FixJ family response regulator
MAQLISQQRDLLVCGEAGNAPEALAAVRSLRPRLVLLDVTLPGQDGLELIKDIKALGLGALILVVSMHDEGLYAERALRAGASGYLMKNQGGDQLLAAMRHVLEGNVYVSKDLGDKILDLFSGRRRRPNQSALNPLTDREFEVFQCVGQGMSTREIGSRLHISAKTVETHRLHIRDKLALKTTPELLRFAVRWAGSQDLI